LNEVLFRQEIQFLMIEATLSVAIVEEQEDGHADRRGAVRIPCDLETACQAIAARGDTVWTGRMRNISRTGIALEVGRRFERGTMLAVQLEVAAGAFQRTMFARVVHVQALDSGAWLVGCTFAGEMDDDDLSHFQVERRRPAEPDGRAWVRFECDLAATAFRIRGDREESFAVRVVNIAPGGMGLHVDYPVETGTFLRVELPGVLEQGKRCREVRVIKVVRQEDRGWILGCELAASLGPDELRALADTPIS
jgi:PilZ domain